MPFGLVALALIPLVIAQTSPRPHRIDARAPWLLLLGVVAMVFGLINAGGAGWSDPVTLVSLAVAVAMATVFVAVERRVDEPLVPLRLFAQRTTSAAYLAMLLVPAVMVGMYFFTAHFL